MMHSERPESAAEAVEAGLAPSAVTRRGGAVHAHCSDEYRSRLRSIVEAAAGSDGRDVAHALRTIEHVNHAAAQVQVYDSRYAHEIHEDSKLPFRISADPFVLPAQIELQTYGRAFVAYYAACKKLHRSLDAEHHWRRYLDRSKPSWMLEHADRETRDHLFLRPDLIVTNGQPLVTEIETSPFGLGLSYFLDKAYKQAGTATACDEQQVLDALGQSVCFVVTDHTSRYRGQFVYLAQELTAKTGVHSSVVSADEVEMAGTRCVADGHEFERLYRAFYLHEASDDDRLRAIATHARTFPPCRPQLEEKALMGILWEPEFESFLRAELGEETFTLLQSIIPRTWVVDGERIPRELGIETWGDLAKISAKQRKYVLKPSGFSPDSSWCRGIVFLQKSSREHCRKALEEATHSRDLYVLQEFKQGKKFPHRYFDFHAGALKEMEGRVRVTPYYSAADGRLITAKATLRAQTDLIHCAVDSINVPVLESRT